ARIIYAGCIKLANTPDQIVTEALPTPERSPKEFRKFRHVSQRFPDVFQRFPFRNPKIPRVSLIDSIDSRAAAVRLEIERRDGFGVEVRFDQDATRPGLGDGGAEALGTAQGGHFEANDCPRALTAGFQIVMSETAVAAESPDGRRDSRRGWRKRAPAVQG
ncbi:MAG: hypothetical protein ACM3U2_08240, partial [Deltaproteobacteria bacterium]